MEYIYKIEWENAREMVVIGVPRVIKRQNMFSPDPDTIIKQQQKLLSEGVPKELIEVSRARMVDKEILHTETSWVAKQ